MSVAAGPRAADDRIARAVLAAVARYGPLTAEDLRTLVRGKGVAVDRVVRALVAGGRLVHLGRRRGYALADRGRR